MKAAIFSIAVVFIGLGLAAVAAKSKRRATGLVSAKPPLTQREQAMFFRLQAAFPEHVVLAQVAFSALIKTKDRPTRATFDRKVCDFV